MRVMMSGAIMVFGFGIALEAAPLQREIVSAEAKWLLHADLDNLRQTQLGRRLFTDVIQKSLAKTLADLNHNFNLELDVDKLESITAYGESFRAKPKSDGVLLLRTGMKVDQLLQTLVAQQTNLAPQMDVGAVELVQQEPYKLYGVEGELFLVPWRSMLLASQSRSQLDKAMQVIEGKKPNLKSSRAFADFPSPPEAFFFLAVAEGFNPDQEKPEKDQEENDPFNKIAKNLPPQAKILQMADGGRVVLGEKADNVFVHLALKAKTKDSAIQIQQVLQGMSALLALSKANNPDFFLPPINITTETRTVLINVDYPVDKVLRALDDFEPGAKVKPRPHKHQPKKDESEPAPEKETPNP
jgi:hypothetical protein